MTQGIQNEIKLKKEILATWIILHKKKKVASHTQIIVFFQSLHD